jgi:hypothetical protein
VNFLFVQVLFNVISKDLKRLGYEVVPRSQGSATAKAAQGSNLATENHGPADGIGLTAKADAKPRKSGSPAEAIMEEAEEIETVDDDHYDGRHQQPREVHA